MADSPEMVVVDPDVPTDHSVKQTLATLPTWEEWLLQQSFKHEPATKHDHECYRRAWPQYGRGWKILVRVYSDTLQVYTFNNPFRYGKPFAFAEVAERSIPGVVGNLIAEIERPVSDATKKRRIAAYVSGVERQKREDRVVLESVPFWVVKESEDLDDPARMSAKQLERILNRVRTGCYVKGQRVRVKPVTHGGTRLVGKMGTVVSASDNSCYVTLDDFVAVGDTDSFRFMQDEVEPVFESQDADPDLPGPYIKALDYIDPLRQMGYLRAQHGEYVQAYGGKRYGRTTDDRLQGQLTIRVQPQVDVVAAIFFIEYVLEGERNLVAALIVPALDVMDVATSIERLVRSEQVNGISEFMPALYADPFVAKHTKVVYVPTEHLLHTYGESLEADADMPQPYLDELVRRSGFVDVFRHNGFRLSRPPGKERPYYSLFWIPSAVHEVSYDIYLEPLANGDWEVSAEGLKMFTVGDREISEPFDINWSAVIPAAMSPEEAMETLKEALLTFTGPAEPTPLERDWDDLDESEEGIDFTQYAKDSADYNPVQLLTAADIRHIVRAAGYRVRSLYRSQRTTGWTLDVVPSRERMAVFRDTPYKEQEYLDKAMFEGITKRLPMLGQMLRGCYVYYEKLDVRCWYDLHTQSVRIDIWPIDHAHRKKGLLKPVRHEGLDDPAPYLDRLEKAQYCPRCGSHETECIGLHSTLPGGYGSGVPQEFWRCNACGDRFLWSDDRSVGFKLEGLDDPDDAASMVKRTRLAKLGEIVNIICPKCGYKHQTFKNWPDDAPREWGFPCPECRAHIPLVNVVVESVAEPPRVRLSENFPDVQDDPSDDPEQYAKTTFDPVQFLQAAGWKHHSDQAYVYYAKTFPMPHYQMGGMVFTGVQVRIGTTEHLFGSTSVAAHFVNDNDNGLGVNGWQLSKQEVYPWNDEDGPIPDKYCDSTMPLRRFALGISQVLASIPWPEGRYSTTYASSLVNTEIGKFVKSLNAQAAVPLYKESPVEESAEDVDKPAERYVQQLGTVEHVALMHGMSKLYTSDTEGGWMRTLKLRHPIEIKATDYLSHLGMNFIGELRLVVRYERKPNTLFPKQQKHELAVFVRVPYVGENSGSKLNHVLWRTSAEFTQESTAAYALNQVLTYAQQSLDDSHGALNLQRTKEILNMGVSPFMVDDVNESEDVDDPGSFINQMPKQTYVAFTRRYEEDQEFAEANFPGEPLEQALGKQLLREIAEANVFDMAKLRVVGFEPVDADVYKVRLAFAGDFGSDEALRDLIQSTYREAAVAGEFNIEQYVPPEEQQVRCRHCGRSIKKAGGVWVDPEATGDDSVWRETCDAHNTFAANHEPQMSSDSGGGGTDYRPDYWTPADAYGADLPEVDEALDPDDPNMVLQSHPGFGIRHASYLGDMVFLKGPGEDKSDWPRDIGRIILGPSPAPEVNPEQRWYVIGVRGIPPEKLSELGFGIARNPKLRTFDGPNDAALAIWLIWSRLPKNKQQGLLLP